MSESLLSCPFCGDTAQIIEGYRSGIESRGRINFVQCNDCGAQGEKFAGFDSCEKAIEAWNRRF